MKNKDKKTRQNKTLRNEKRIKNKNKTKQKLKNKKTKTKTKIKKKQKNKQFLETIDLACWLSQSYS